MDWFTYVFIGGVVWAVWSGFKEAGEREQAKSSMATSVGTVATSPSVESFVGTDGKGGIAVDTADKRVFLFTHGEYGRISRRTVSYQDLLSVELFEDGQMVTKTSRMSQIGGAAVGGALLGGVGAMIGGLSGKTSTSQKVERVELRILVNDSNDPLHDVVFLQKFDAIKYEQAIEKARLWHGRVTVLIRQADEEDDKAETRAKHKALESKSGEGTLPAASSPALMESKGVVIEYGVGVSSGEDDLAKGAIDSFVGSQAAPVKQKLSLPQGMLTDVAATNPPPATSGSTAPVGSDIVSEIRKIAALREEGLISDDEYAALKAKLIEG